MASRLDVDLTTPDRVGTSLPVVVSNMTAVSGRRMAETVARRGAIAVIPQDISPAAVEKTVGRVKAAHPVYETPITVRLSAPVAEVLALIGKRAHRAAVAVEDGRPVGIITEGDCSDVDRFATVGEVMSSDLVKPVSYTHLDVYKRQLHGVHGDTNATYAVGEIDEESQQLIDVTREALRRGINAVRPGRELNVIGRVIESYARRFGMGVVRDYTGHGIGPAFHSGLIVPHYDAAPDYAIPLEPGMTFTIEPMLNLGTHEWTMWDDDWTVVTADLRRSAQFEHTILVTGQGADILTLA